MAVIPGCDPGSINDPICVSDCGTPLLVDIVNQPISVCQDASCDNWNVTVTNEVEVTNDSGNPLSVCIDESCQPIEVTGLVTIDCGPTTDATVVTYSLANVTQTIAAANPSRRRIIIFNDGSAVLYIKYGTGASTTDHSIHLGAGQSWVEEDYGGVITAVRGSAAAQDLHVTEIECV